MASSTEVAAMRQAIALASSPGVPAGPNPRVGAVVINAQGEVIGRGFHRGAGTDHAEIVALRDAGNASRGATVVVTLEPCNHVGRTGPCTQALLAAGVSRVVYGQRDASPLARGGAATLSATGVQVEGGVLGDQAEQLNPSWTFATIHRRPWVVWKFASTLDGRVAAPDGSSQWITGEQARADGHRLRARVDAVMVGTGTALVDNPCLTARTGDTSARQPLRVVVGKRGIPEGWHLHDAAAPTLQLHSRDLSHVMASLFERDVQTVLLEGGPTLSAAFVAADLIDEVVAYFAPALLGAGAAAATTSNATSIADIQRMGLVGVEQIGNDVKIVVSPRPDGPAGRYISMSTGRS